MPNESLNIGGMNQGALDAELARWAEQDRLSVTNHPKEADYRRVSGQAQSLLQRMSVALTMPGGGQILEQEGQKLAELYEQAVTIRGEIAKAQINASPVTEKDIEDATAHLPENFASSITRDLGSLNDAFGVNPADTLTGNPEGNKFFMAFRGKTGVNFEQVDKARKTLEKLREAGASNPALATLANKFEANLQRVEATDPFRAAQHRWYQEHVVGQKLTDGKPLRILGTLVGGFITAIGIGQTVFSENHELSPATVGWGLATALFVRPDLIKGGSSRVLDQIAALGNPHIHDLIAGGFKGPEGRSAFEELQEIRGADPAALKALLKSEQPITIAQIGALTGGTNTPLLRVLSRIPENRRRDALSTFGGSMSNDERELMGQMIEARV